MISVLYFIRKINAQYSKKTNNINAKGNNIEECIALVPLTKFILFGWWRVFHQSTEYFIIGILINPIIAIRLEILLALVVVYMILSGHLVLSCSRIGFREAFDVAKSLGGAATDYRMGDGVEGSWDGREQNDRDSSETVVNGTHVPLTDTLFFFRDNKGQHKNCDTNYSTSTGCIGLTAEQNKYLNTRGGNRITGNF